MQPLGDREDRGRLIARQSILRVELGGGRAHVDQRPRERAVILLGIGMQHRDIGVPGQPPVTVIRVDLPDPSIPKRSSSAARSAPIDDTPMTRTPRWSACRISLCQTDRFWLNSPSTIRIAAGLERSSAVDRSPWQIGGHSSTSGGQPERFRGERTDGQRPRVGTASAGARGLPLARARRPAMSSARPESAAHAHRVMLAEGW